MKQAHICLDETLGIRYAILPGDPARLDRIAKELTDVQELAYNREFRSLRGRYKGVDVLALSTGIGGSSAGIAVEELHNIGITAAIRIGSCGALQKGIGLGELILVSGAVRDDGASKAYVPAIFPAVADFTLSKAVSVFGGNTSYDKDGTPHFKISEIFMVMILCTMILRKKYLFII